MYAADASEITNVPGGVEMTFAFTPAGFASSDPVAGQPLVRDVTPTAPQGTTGSLAVTLQFPATAVTRTFMPFDALVH
jgi:hypothetical protein